MALKRCPFPHEYVEDEDYIEVKNESIYESNRALFEEIIRECFEPLKKYNLETELKFFK